MDKFIETNKEKLLNIYEENVKSQGNGILFIDFSESENLKVDCSFVPNNMIETFCSKQKYIDFNKVKNNISDDVVFFIFDKKNLFLIK
jgi:hypothetical protein